MALHRLDSVADALDWLRARGVRTLTTDSRRVVAGVPGAAFIAWPGYALDGRRFVPAALAAGASACLVEAEGAAQLLTDVASSPKVAALAGLKAATGALASAFMGTPSARLKVIAITGTNGKTSTAWWLAQALTALGQRCGVIGTLGVGEPPATLPVGQLAQAAPAVQAAQASSAPALIAITFTGLTTPDPVTLQAGLKQFADAGFTACAIEASSIGLSEQRLTGTQIATAVFTNFTQDHLDHHGSMANYWQAKAALFAWPGLRAAVLNVDDAQGAVLAQTLQALPPASGSAPASASTSAPPTQSAPDVWTCSITGAARLRATALRYEGGGLCFDLHEQRPEGEVRVGVTTQLIGAYNVANLLGVIGALRASGVALNDAAAACARLTPVPGRMQRVTASDRTAAEPSSTPQPQPQVVVDYAHTPDALEHALRALQPFATERGGALWCVFGCGGNRDAGKRPLMGAIAQQLATQLVVTSDNPRHEAPAAILAQISAGLGADAAHALAKVAVIEDRRAAIEHAVRHADARDVILVAGKGHETDQDIAGVKHHFSDAEVARAALQRRDEINELPIAARGPTQEPTPESPAP